jgi:hypothetical protein
MLWICRWVRFLSHHSTPRTHDLERTDPKFVLPRHSTTYIPLTRSLLRYITLLRLSLLSSVPTQCRNGCGLDNRHREVTQTRMRAWALWVVLACTGFGRHHGCDATQLTAADLVGASATTFQTSVTAANTSTSATRVAARTVVTAGTTTTTTSTTANAGCGGVTRCLNHTHCAKCLEAINATAGFAHSLASFDNFESAAFREYTVAFFQTLQSTVSCSTSATPPSILHPALEELDGVNSCIVEYRMITGNCILSRVSATAWRLEAHVCELAQNTLALNRCLAHSGHWLQPPGAWRHTFVSSHRMRWPLMGARLMQAQILARRHSAARTSVHSRRACTSAPLCVLHTPSLAWQPPIPHHPQWCSISAILLWTNRTLACSNRI